jgi:hypothetical protein
MQSRLVKEIAKTIRALEELAIDWEKHFPENERKGSRIIARTPGRRLAQILKTPPQRVAGRGINSGNQGHGHRRIRESGVCGEAAVGKGERVLNHSNLVCFNPGLTASLGNEPSRHR